MSSLSSSIKDGELGTVVLGVVIGGVILFVFYVALKPRRSIKTGDRYRKLKVERKQDGEYSDMTDSYQPLTPYDFGPADAQSNAGNGSSGMDDSDDSNYGVNPFDPSSYDNFGSAYNESSTGNPSDFTSPPGNVADGFGLVSADGSVLRALYRPEMEQGAKVSNIYSAGKGTNKLKTGLIRNAQQERTLYGGFQGLNHDNALDPADLVKDTYHSVLTGYDGSSLKQIPRGFTDYIVEADGDKSLKLGVIRPRIDNKIITSTQGNVQRALHSTTDLMLGVI